MPEPQDYEESAALLRQVAAFLYGSSKPRPSITLEELYAGLGLDNLAVDPLLKKMESNGLISLDLRGLRMGFLGKGKVSFERDCIAEVALGRDYITKKYMAAVVHIIVEDAEGQEAGGTGFFAADPRDRIVTAAHVVSGRRIKRIDDRLGNQLPFRDGRTMAPGDLDLATIECGMPSDVEPIRVELEENAASLGAELIVFGYPKVASHMPSLYTSKSELHSIPKRYPSPRDSLIISSTTHPGCSGGPVIDLRGFAIGVIEQENTLEMRTGASTFFGATPAHYLKEFAWSEVR
jgi:hypothetical protein